MRLVQLLFTAAVVGVVCAFTPTPTKTKRWDNGFVSIQGDQFIRNGEPFKFLGTNAYWLASLNTDEDINATIHNIAKAGINVVRTWAFNDVPEIPVNGTWFQLIANGTTTINNGTNGLQKLDKVVQFAEDAGVVLILSLTNNWNPLPLLDNTTIVPVDGLRRRDVTVGTNNSLPRNFLSNDYGGIDAYVREFSEQKKHDDFYTNETILNIFKNYTTQIVTRYKDSPAVLTWELANDPRCNSSISSTLSCNTNTVTTWHDNVATHIRSIDPNHIISSGSQGFICTNCPKLFPLAPKPAISPAVRSKKRHVKPLTKERLIRERNERWKKTRDLKKRELFANGEGIRIRGRWIASRQTAPENSLGSAFDGSSGVDAQDILNIPSIGFGSFQLFPDQNTYITPDPNLSAFNNTVEEGIQWIQLQANLAALVGKPTVLTAFGLVTQDNAPFFVPFNSTLAPFNGTNSSAAISSSSTPPAGGSTSSASFGVTNAEQDDAYSSWINAALSSGINGALQYQWGQQNLTTSPGSTISPNTDESGVTPNSATSGSSPNDGYQSAPTGSDGVQPLLSSLASAFSSGF